MEYLNVNFLGSEIMVSHKRQTLSAIRMNVTMHYGITGLPA